MKAGRVRQDGTRVVVEIPNGAMPWEAAIELGKALISAGKLAESEQVAEAIIADAALGIRAGFPIGLAPTHKHGQEALKQAQWDSQLRRAPMVGEPGAVYAPTLTQRK